MPDKRSTDNQGSTVLTACLLKPYTYAILSGTGQNEHIANKAKLFVIKTYVLLTAKVFLNKFSS